jgi:hypothetical protein
MGRYSQRFENNIAIYDFFAERVIQKTGRGDRARL